MQHHAKEANVSQNKCSAVIPIRGAAFRCDGGPEMRSSASACRRIGKAPERRDLSRGRGVEVIHGNGFGCVVLRGSVVRDTVFTATIDFAAYDVAFYHRIRETQWRVKVDWTVECQHFSGETS